MENLFTTQASNKHQSLLLRQPDMWQSIVGGINRRSLLAGWVPLEFDFQILDNKAAKLPSICTVYLPGVLAFRSDLRATLFPVESAEIEFLPIFAGKEPWFLMNCLKSVEQIDEQQSHLMRGLTGEIFMVLKVRVIDPDVKESEMFTLAGSNHGQLFVRASFKDRVERLCLTSVTFKNIGELA